MCWNHFLIFSCPRICFAIICHVTFFHVSHSIDPLKSRLQITASNCSWQVLRCQGAQAQQEAQGRLQEEEEAAVGREDQDRHWRRQLKWPEPAVLVPAVHALQQRQRQHQLQHGPHLYPHHQQQPPVDVHGRRLRPARHAPNSQRHFEQQRWFGEQRELVRLCLY